MKKKILALSLSLSLIFGLGAVPVFAAESDNAIEATEAGKQGTIVTITLDNGKEVLADSFTVMIPKTLTASTTDTVSYNVTASGFLNEGKTLSVTPASVLTLKPSASDAKNKNITLTSNVSQAKTSWTPDDLSISGGSSTTGSLSPVTFNTSSEPGSKTEGEPTGLSDLSGEFTGTLVFTIAVE